MAGVWARKASKKFRTPYVFLQPLKPATQIWYITCLQTSLPKTTFWTKIGGGLGQGSSLEKFGTPYVFLQPLKPAVSNLVHKLGLGLAYQKTKQRFGPKLAGVWATGAYKKWDSLRIFATVEASNFNFGTQTGFGSILFGTMFRTKIGGGLGQGSIRKNLGPPTYFCNR